MEPGAYDSLKVANLLPLAADLLLMEPMPYASSLRTRQVPHFFLAIFKLLAIDSCLRVQRCVVKQYCIVLVIMLTHFHAQDFSLLIIMVFTHWGIIYIVLCNITSCQQMIVASLWYQMPLLNASVHVCYPWHIK